MRIERPDWGRMGSPFLTKSTMNRWFEEKVEPINKMLSEGTKVEGYFTDSGYWIYDISKPTHKALLINIEPIKKDTAEDVLRDFVEAWEGRSGFTGKELSQRAKAVLGE